MKIELIDDYVLTTDAYNFIINRKGVIQKGKNKGKETLVTLGFYPTLLQALQGLIKEKQLQSKARTLNGLIKECQELTEYFCEILPTLKDKVSKKGKMK